MDLFISHFWLYIASQNISIHSIIRNKCKVTRMGQYQQLIICRNTKKCFSRSARLTSQANILVAVRIIPRFFHRLKGFLNGIRILIGKMPPFSGIALEAMLFHHLLKKPSISRSGFRAVCVISVSLSGKIIKAGWHFQFVAVQIDQGYIHCTAPTMRPVSGIGRRNVCRIRASLP